MSNGDHASRRRWRLVVSNFLLMLGIPVFIIGVLVAMETGSLIAILFGVAFLVKYRLLRPDPDEIVIRRALPDLPDQVDTAYIARAPGSDEDRRA